MNINPHSNMYLYILQIAIRVNKAGFHVIRKELQANIKLSKCQGKIKNKKKHIYYILMILLMC